MTAQALADEIRYALDIVAWCREKVRFHPDPWQIRVLTSTAPQTLLNITRQGGKSSICALVAAHHAIYRPDSLVLMISRAQRQAKELYHKVKGIFAQLGVVLLSDNEASSLLQNRSRLMALPGDGTTIRGFAPTMVIFDEAGFCSDETYAAVRPMLAVTRGRLMLISTPNGQRGFFHAEWTSGLGWYREKITADQCPRISSEFLRRNVQHVAFGITRNTFANSLTAARSFSARNLSTACSPPTFRSCG